MTGVPTSARALARARLAHNLLAIRKTAYKDLRRLAAEIGAVGDREIGEVGERLGGGETGTTVWSISGSSASGRSIDACET